MSLSLYDTARRAIVPFRPQQPGRVAMYNCGPTVYSTAHVGNFRSFLLADVLRRHLEQSGLAVHQVMNITDVGHLTVDDQADASGEDKLLATARRLGWDPWQVARHFEEEFHEHRRTLQIRDAHHYPRATAHVADMLAMIQRLLERGHAYVSEGEVYFDVASFPDYGALSGRSVDDQQAGARVAVHQAKRHPADFALWKSDPGHLMQFDPHDPDLWTDWPGERPVLHEALQRGFPGWHIECSAMAARYLGTTFDIHTGGEDNLFPHHECEVAQSTAAHDAPLAHWWLHTRHLMVDGKKLSKRDGTAVTVPELAEQGFEPRVVRFALLSHHYRKPMNLTVEGLVAAREAVQRLRTLRDTVKHAAGEAAGPAATIRDEVDALQHAWTAAMDDDLNVPNALAAVFRAIKPWERQTTWDAHDARTVWDGLQTVNAVLDVFDDRVRSGSVAIADLPSAVSVDDALNELQIDDPATIVPVLAARHRARCDKDWSVADRLRTALQAAGITVRDGAETVHWCAGGKPG